MALVATAEGFVTHKLIGGVYTWENLGDGSLFDLHESYVTYTDLEKTKTGICFNAGDDRPLVKYVPALVDVWITLDYYNAGQWRWVQVFLNDDKKIGLNGTDNDTFFRFYTDEYAGKEGINTLQLHFNVIENIAEIWINGTKGVVVSNAKLSSPITSISFSPSGWASNYASHTRNAMSNITIKGTIIEVDETLPEGAGGWVNTYLTHRPHDGLDVRKLEVFYTYKRDDLINLWEGTDSQIAGITESYVTHRPHSGLDVRQLEPYINYRPHDGLDIRQLDVYATVRHEDAIDTYKMPYGIGGYIEAFALYRVLLLAGFLHNFKEIKIKGVAVENHYVPLKSIFTFNRVEMINNNTEDLETEVDNE